jgi:hypothetical protein
LVRLAFEQAGFNRCRAAQAPTSQHVDGDDAAVLAALRRRNEVQMQKLLRSLGVDPSRPDAWVRGFFLLAYYHHGVGHFAWHPRRTNRNAAKWTPAEDLELLREVIVLKQDGLSERRAIAKIAADSKKMRLFPYREQKARYFPKGTDRARREAALWAHFQKLVASTRGRSLFDLFGSVSSDGLSFWERTLRALDDGDYLRSLEKKFTTD